MQILIVEDEVRLSQSIQKGLKAENFSVDIANDGEEGLRMMIKQYDLIILDLMLPKISGLELLKKIRQQGNQIPVLVLTAKVSTDDKITGLNLGADDYLPKPFNFDELLARIKALIRRSTKSNVKLKIDNLELDPHTKEVYRAGQIIRLSSTEYRLLEYLMHHPYHTLSETNLLDHVWDHNYDGFSNVVSVYIRYLRNKIDKPFPREKSLIQTVRGLGYKISDK